MSKKNDKIMDCKGKIKIKGAEIMRAKIIKKYISLFIIYNHILIVSLPHCSIVIF